MKFGSITTGIIADGLVFNMDAANRASYIPDATTAFNTTNLSQSGSLQGVTNITPPTSASCWNFDGTDDYINTVSTTHSDSLTISFWIKGPTHAGTVNIIGGTDFFQHFDDFSSHGNLYIYDSGVPNWINVVPSIFDNTWHCATVTLNDTTSEVKGYKDGILVSTTTWQASYSNNIIQKIGRYQQSDMRYFQGDISLIHLYNRTLSSNEVLHNYNALKGRFGLT
tara:strand:- start:214 stop:885 length:672 start_codon:yes stop_codon:yes gene_type:complete